MSYNNTCAPRKDSFQPAHSCSLIRVFVWHYVGSQRDKAFSGRHSDQPTWMHMLILVFAGSTCNLVRNALGSYVLINATIPYLPYWDVLSIYHTSPKI